MLRVIRRVEDVAQVECRKSNVAAEHLHIQLPVVKNVSLPHFHESSKIRTGPPAVAQQIARQGVQHNVHTTARGPFHKLG